MKEVEREKRRRYYGNLWCPRFTTIDILPPPVTGRVLIELTHTIDQKFLTELLGVENYKCRNIVREDTT